MKTLVIYATKYGCTEKCARLLAEKLTGDVELFNLKNVKNIDVAKYDKVVIGSSVYMGQIQKEAKEFCINNLSQLQGKKVGFFTCSMRDGEQAEEQIKMGFPAELLSNAIVQATFGGEFDFKKMNFFEKMIVKMVSKSDPNAKPVDTKQVASTVSEERIREFAQSVNAA